MESINEYIQKRRSSNHLSKNEIKFEKFNTVISFILLIYCMVQVYFSSQEAEPKILDIGANVLTLVLSLIGFVITWQAIKESHNVRPA